MRISEERASSESARKQMLT